MIKPLVRAAFTSGQTDHTQSHTSHARWLVSTIGYVVFWTTLLGPPLGFLAVGYYYETTTVTLFADNLAHAIADDAESGGEVRPPVADLSAHEHDLEGPHNQLLTYSLFDMNGRLVRKIGESASWPILTAAAPIEVAGKTAGSVRVEASLRPYLFFAGLVSLLSSILAVAALVATRVVPLRILDLSNLKLGEQNRRLKQQEEDLQRRNQHLHTALENASKGVCLFDADERIIVANSLYAKIYGLNSEQTRPGEYLRDVIEARISAGTCEYFSSDEYFRERAKRFEGKPLGGVERRILHLKNGKIIANTRQSIPEGGWVCTHEDVTDQHELETALAYQANHDVLTDLPNRKLFNEHIARALGTRQQTNRIAIHLLDLDNFKSVNDTLGHGTGDKLLKSVADRLGSIVAEPNMVARMGGDEFAIVQVDIADLRDVSELAERAIDVISNIHEIDNQQLATSVSVGIAIAPDDGNTPGQLLRCADLALYEVKEKGRGSFSIFQPGLDEIVRNRTSLKSDLRDAIKNGQFELHYQPIIDLQKSENCGVEALVRWNHPTRGQVLPCEFIHLAEESDLIVGLGAWIMKTACTEVAGWPGKFCCAVNLSPVQFRRRGLVTTVLNALSASGLPANRLVLEITESVLLADAEEVIKTLRQLREVGVIIALDDFGTGYSSLSYLRDLPIDVVKIDRSFIRDITQDPAARGIIKAVVSLARALSLTTVAEGVESQEQLNLLRAEGLNKAQGYLFSKPKSAEDVRKYLFPDEEIRRRIA